MNIKRLALSALTMVMVSACAEHQNYMGSALEQQHKTAAEHGVLCHGTEKTIEDHSPECAAYKAALDTIRHFTLA